jgi:hypothetical protein
MEYDANWIRNSSHVKLDGSSFTTPSTLFVKYFKVNFDA